MPKIQGILDEGDQIIETSERSLLKSLDEAEKAIFKEVIKIFDQVDISSGKFVSTEKAKNFIMSLDTRITQALYDSKYRLGVSDLLKDFNKIVQNNIDLQQAINGKTVTKTDLSAIQKIETNNTVDRLLGSGMNKDFIAPIRQTLYRNITLGSGVAETKAALEDYILSTPEKASVLSRYVGQVARDSIMQFDGSIQQAIGAELGLVDYIYTGSLILDSRDQCVYWVGKGELNGADLEGEIQDAIDKKSLTGERPCSGMNPECTVATFSIYRGGYNCRHRAIVSGPSSKNIEIAAPKNAVQVATNAKLAGPRVDKIANDTAKKFGATVTPINYKTEGSIIRKVKREYNGDFTKLFDGARNTIITDAQKNIDKIIADLQKNAEVIKIKKQVAETDALGYSGNIINIKTGNVISEIQVNTPEIIYGKEKEDVARGLLGDKKYNEIAKRTGIKGGLGHTYYEEYRKLNKKIPKDAIRIKELVKISKEYYASLRAA